MRRIFPPAPVITLALVVAFLCAGCGASQRDRGSLSVAARISVAGAVQPVGQETLYLLDDDLIRLAMEEVADGDEAEARAHREHPRLKTLAGLMNARRFAAYRLGPDVALLFAQSRPIWERHVVQTARTDGGGRAVFAQLAPGNYWLVCLSERGGKLAFWNLRVTAGSAPQEIVLDEHNALTVNDATGER